MPIPPIPMQPRNTKPLTDQGWFTIPWQTFFDLILAKLPSGGSGAAPADAEYVVAAADGDLPNADVATSTTSITVDTATAGQMQWKRAALTGDVTASANSNATTIPNDTVTYAKMQNVSAASRFLGRGSAAGSGDVQELSPDGTTVTISGTTVSAVSGGAGINQLTGDVTAGPGVGSQAATIANDAVTFAKMQDIATQRLIGRNTAGSGDPEEVTISQALDWLP